jgi:hypothetical protein
MNGELELARRRLARVQQVRGVTVAFLLASLLMVAVGQAGGDGLFVFQLGLVAALCAENVMAGLLARRVRAAACRPGLDLAGIEAAERDAWGEVFHCFRHPALAEDGVLPVLHEGKCGECAKATRVADGARVTSDSIVWNEPGFHLAQMRALRSADYDGFAPEAVDSLIAEAEGLKEMVMRAGTMSGVTFDTALKIRAALLEGRRSLRSHRARAECPEMVKVVCERAAAQAARFTEVLTAADPTLVECPSMGEPPGCGQLVPTTRRDSMLWVRACVAAWGGGGGSSNTVYPFDPPMQDYPPPREDPVRPADYDG